MRFPKHRGLATAVATAVAVAATACAPWHVPPYPSTPPGVVGKPVSRADAVADLDTLVRILEDVHPDLYANWPRDSARRARDALVAALPPSMSRMDWWIRLAPYMARFDDGHTSIAMPSEELTAEYAAGTLIFPPSVGLDPDRHIVLVAPFATEGALPRGARMVSVNGDDADSLAHAWTAETSGESERYRLANVASSFRTLMLVHGIHAPYVVVIADSSGATRTATLPGITQDSLVAQVRVNRVQRVPGTDFTYRVLQPRIGYMNFRSMESDVPHFSASIAAMFRSVAADSDSTLIVDLRSNGGGDSRLADEFLRHITTASYRLDARKEWKMSAEYREFLKGAISEPLRALHPWLLIPQGRALFTGPPGKIVVMSDVPAAYPRAEPFFTGTVCVLIGTQTFSSAADFADGIETYRLATVIGEETGGRVNTFGEVYPFVLPRTGLRGSVSSARYVRASGDTSDHHGVVPDIIVPTTSADRRAGRDPVLERAKSCPRIQSGTGIMESPAHSSHREP